ncbi:hypothetical protein CRG98_013184 [Punica granatum]|uniref:Myb/SANT-like domain-containing protein n=1 Tax=Punica granatum TaxID=22663 RepID=A0A2I0KCX2_PUNGR|nr:hypothetical protein CRG98_013184 [Punica granatum]
MYKQFTEVLHQTGVGWDEDTNTIMVSPYVWDKFIKKNKDFKTFQTNGCKNYKLLNEFFSSSTAIGALRISSTNPLRTFDENRQVLEEFLSTSKQQ